jgi:hypothetical protein
VAVKSLLTLANLGDTKLIENTQGGQDKCCAVAFSGSFTDFFSRNFNHFKQALGRLVNKPYEKSFARCQHAILSDHTSALYKGKVAK